MKRRRPITMQRLNLSDDEIPLGEKRPDLQLVRLRALPLDATRQVDGAELQDGELGRGHVDAPPPRLDFRDAAYYEVADFGGVAGAEGAYGDELVGFGDGAGDGGGDVCGAGRDVGAVSPRGGV